MCNFVNRISWFALVFHTGDWGWLWPSLPGCAPLFYALAGSLWYVPRSYVGLQLWYVVVNRRLQMLAQTVEFIVCSVVFSGAHILVYCSCKFCWSYLHYCTVALIFRLLKGCWLSDVCSLSGISKAGSCLLSHLRRSCFSCSLFVCLFVCLSETISKSYVWIWNKFYESVVLGKKQNWWMSVSDYDCIVEMSNILFNVLQSITWCNICLTYCYYTWSEAVLCYFSLLITPSFSYHGPVWAPRL